MDLSHDATLRQVSKVPFGSHATSVEEFLGHARNHGAISERQSGITSTTTDDRSKNVLRPITWDDVVGQERVKALLRRMAERALSLGRVMDHTLFVGPSGTGKTTLAHVLSHQLDVRVFQLEAPVSHDTLMELRETMERGDILFVDEIHQQAVQDRRGRQSSTQPEVLFGVMEDFTLATQYGVLPFPQITVIGGTTDEGALPDAFINRFPVRPRMEKYSESEMAQIVHQSAAKLGLIIGPEAASLFARASRGVPREVNNYLRNAASLADQRVSVGLASEVLFDLNGVAEDGLTADMQRMLVFLYTRAKHTHLGTGEVKYQASVATIATAIGKSRDQKAIALRVEPYLIEKGYVQVGHGGRRLTTDGIIRARELVKQGVQV